MAMTKFNDLMLVGIKQGFSDLHISGGQPLVYRKDGVVHFDRNITWTSPEIDNLVQGMLSARQLGMLKQRWSVDCAMTINRVRIRMNVFNTTRGLSLAVRILPEIIPDFNALNLHPSLKQIKDLKAGLVLVCGSTGSGKSTTLAVILEEINRTRSVHIITLEDPIEYRFKPKKAFIEQREVGVHVPSFKQGLLDVLREAPDIIFVGELREPDTIRLTLTAAESGHLVFASLHANDSEDAVYRINNAVPGKSQDIIRYQFASTLSWLITQQLGKVEGVDFRLPVLSILRGSIPVKNIIRENKLNQLETAMHMGKGDGMFTMERYLNEFIGDGSAFKRPYKSAWNADEAGPETDYKSPLIDPNAVQDVVYMASIDDASTFRNVEKKTSEGYGLDQQYVIDEAPNLEDLLSQMGLP
jgi:twitching motility protein PilT